MTNGALELLEMLPVEPTWARYAHLKTDLGLPTQKAVAHLVGELMALGLDIKIGRAELRGRWVPAACLGRAGYRAAQAAAATQRERAQVGAA